MKENLFWKLLEKLNWDMTGDDEAVLEPVISELSSMSEADICGFEDILTSKLYALDTLAHAKEIGEDSYIDEDEFFSADAFLYSRCVVVANGKGLFDLVMSNPTEFPKDMEFEALLGIAPEAFERKTGKEWDYVSPLSYETFSNKEGWKNA